MSPAFFEILAASGPHPSLGRHADTYGRVIGSWRGELKNHTSDKPATSTIEVHFAWVLEGRAIQDVWITPARSDRNRGTPTLDWFGSTLRVFDPNSESWRARWTDPVSQIVIELEGRRIGDDIVQIGTRGGVPIRWTFSSIRDRSFHWQGHILEPDGVTWRLEVDMQLQRA